MCIKKAEHEKQDFFIMIFVEKYKNQAFIAQSESYVSSSLHLHSTLNIKLYNSEKQCCMNHVELRQSKIE